MTRLIGGGFELGRVRGAEEALHTKKQCLTVENLNQARV